MLSATRWILQYIFLTVIRWIVISLLDSITHTLNNWAKVQKAVEDHVTLAEYS